MTSSIPVAAGTTTSAIPTNAKGEFQRNVTQFRHSIDPLGDFPPEPNRYHLYVSLACPWAHRTLMARVLKGLQEVISVSVVHYLMKPHGWEFADGVEVPGCIPDPVNNCKLLREVYLLSDPDFSGRVTVPVLFDKKTKRIVNNESSEILRIFNSAFNKFCANPTVDLYPEELRSEIDRLNDLMYDGLNNGVYKAGFATTQEAYEPNAKLVRDTLLKFEEIMGERPSGGYLVGDQLTEADLRLFATLVRFDPVYVGHFKCNLVTVRELPALSTWLKRIFELPGIAKTVNMEHIKRHYYMSHVQINPSGVVPLYNGPLFE